MKFLVGLGLLLAALECHAADTNAPIGFRYIKNGQFNNRGYITSGTIFWATNHTSSTFGIHLAAIEFKAGSNWVTHSRLMQRLAFQPPGKPFPEMELKPHEAGYATAQLTNLPTGVPWRAKVVVQEKLSGLSDTAARIRYSPDIVERRFRTGNTNLPMNPFAKSLSFYGKPIEVVSQEIAEE